MEHNVLDIVLKFDLKGQKVQYLDKYGSGHINVTYLLITDQGNKYIFQKINNHVFPNVKGLMENVNLVTSYLTEIIKKNGGDPSRETLSLVPTLDGEAYYYDEKNDAYYRLYNFVKDSVTLMACDNEELFAESARGFANFGKQLNDFDASKLCEVIPNFHNTKVRFQHFLKTLKEDKLGRASSCKEEIDFVLAHEKDTSVLVDLIENKQIPLRVTHNDTKLNNILLDKNTMKSLCVIDLDTVMPGSILYDFGDSIRFGCNPAGENERDLTKVNFKVDYFKAFYDAFLEVIGDSLTEAEIKNLPFAGKLMTLECGIRFLDDYLDGDNYFAIHESDDNLVRARTQFKLVRDMEEIFK